MTTPFPIEPGQSTSLCREVLEALESLLDNVMPETDADLIRAHIETCDPCTEAADAEVHVRELVRRACQEKAPEQLRIRIVSQVIVRSVR